MTNGNWQAGLASAGNVLYGMGLGGAVFSLKTDGSGLTILHSAPWAGVSTLLLSGNSSMEDREESCSASHCRFLRRN
jgi:hypothetical protein